MYHVELVNKTRPYATPLILQVCNTFFSRFRGYMLKDKIITTEGLLFVESYQSRLNSSIHMFFMRFTLGVIWLDTEKRVVDKKFARTWRPYYAPHSQAIYTIEIHPDRLGDFSIGDQVDFQNV
jgi:uncharacterized protein